MVWKKHASKKRGQRVKESPAMQESYNLKVNQGKPLSAEIIQGALGVNVAEKKPCLRIGITLCMCLLATLLNLL